MFTRVIATISTQVIAMTITTMTAIIGWGVIKTVVMLETVETVDIATPVMLEAAVTRIAVMLEAVVTRIAVMLEMAIPDTVAIRIIG
jgi:hypothetical protein